MWRRTSESRHMTRIQKLSVAVVAELAILIALFYAFTKAFA